MAQKLFAHHFKFFKYIIYSFRVICSNALFIGNSKKRKAWLIYVRKKGWLTSTCYEWKLQSIGVDFISFWLTVLFKLYFSSILNRKARIMYFKMTVKKYLFILMIFQKLIIGRKWLISKGSQKSVCQCPINWNASKGNQAPI